MTGRVRQAVIMVGGRGTRLLPLTETRPKPMLPVADRPCIWYLLRSMARAGVEEVILACGYKPGMMEALGDGSDLGLDLRYSYEDRPMGTAGAMKLVEDMLDDTFVAANGDVFADLDVAGEIRTHLSTGADITDLLIPVENPCDYGIACVDDSLRITQFKDKPRPEEVFSNLINAGVYVVDRDVLRYVPSGEFFDFSMDLMPRAIAEGRHVQGHRLDGLWMDVGRPHDLLRANLEVAASEYGGTDWPATGSEIAGRFYMGRGASVEGSDVRDTVVSEGSVLRDSSADHVLLMGGCTVEGSVIRDSVLGEGCVVGRGSVVENAVLGDGTVLEPGTRLDGKRSV